MVLLVICAPAICRRKERRRENISGVILSFSLSLSLLSSKSNEGERETKRRKRKRDNERERERKEASKVNWPRLSTLSSFVLFFSPQRGHFHFFPFGLRGTGEDNIEPAIA